MISILITRLGGGWLQREGRATEYRFRWLVSEEDGEAGFGDDRGELGGVEAREVGELPRMVIVVTKIDLLPTELSPTRLEHWVRQRAREGGVASKMTSVHMVSAVRDWGLKNLVEDVVGLASREGMCGQ